MADANDILPIEDENFLPEFTDLGDDEHQDNEERLYAVSLHDEVVIFNREDGTWYSRTYSTVEIAIKVYEIESKRLEQV